MEGVSVNVYKGLTRYWSRRGYRRLGAGESPSGATPPPGGARPARRRFRWRRVRVAPRVRLIVRSPKRFLVWLRDAYVRMMMGLATSRVCSAASGYTAAEAGVAGFGKAPLKEYDQRVLVEIYRSLVAAREAGDLRSQGLVVCHR